MPGNEPMLKSLLPVGLLLLILAPGCSKSHSPQPGLIGQWQLSNAVSVTPGTVIDYAAGMVLDLRSDSTYTQTISGRIIGSGAYSTYIVNVGIVPSYFITFKPAGSATIYTEGMQVGGLRLNLYGKYATEYFQKI
jgi:hypothetical protein